LGKSPCGQIVSSRKSRRTRIVKGIMGTQRSQVCEGDVEQVCNELDLLDDENRRAFAGVQFMADKVRSKLLEEK
jgi:hypothetical protein